MARTVAGGRLLRGQAVLAAAVVALLSGAIPARAEAPETVKVTAHTDRSGGRLLFDAGRPIQYSVQHADPYVFIRFSRPHAGDLETAQRALSGYLSELRWAGGGRVVVLRMSGQPRFTHVKRGNAVILTWTGAAAPAEKPADTKGPNGVPKSAEKKPVPPPTVKKSEIPPVKLPSPDEIAKLGPGSGTKPEPKAVPREPPAGAMVSPTLTVGRNGVETRIALAWPEPVSAAIFRYGDQVWLVFSRRETFDLAPFQGQFGPGIERLTRIEHADATVLTVRARADVRAEVQRERNTWTVVLKREAGPMPEQDVKLAITRGATEQVGAVLPGADAPIRIVDPQVGSTLFVIPSRAGAAIAAERRFVTFRLVPALQGAVIEALADGLTVTADGAGFAIRRSGGLLLSGGPHNGSRPGQ